MIYLAYFILCFTMMQFLVAAVNILWGRFTYKAQRRTDTLVSVLIPARNEENNIGGLLNDLKDQHYSNIEIIVFDDQSTDGTACIVAAAAQADKRVRLIPSSGLPDGWLGKNNACHQLAQHASGNYYLFLDADVRINRDTIGNALEYMKKHKLVLLSLFPRQQMFTPGEWSTVPIMNYILLTLLPLVMVSKSGFVSLAAANGQFMFFDATVYRKIMPHEKLKSSSVEDIGIARYLKHERYNIACLSGNRSVHCRMYKGFDEAINGFAKNVTHFFGNSFVLAILFWVVTTFGFIPVLLVLPVFSVVLYFCIIVVTRVFVAISSGQSKCRNLLFLIPQHFAFCLFIYKAFINKQNKQMVWKDRNIS